MAYALERFVDAQQTVYDEALAELRRGRKNGHWMWFIFPQLRGLGRSAMAQHYGIASIEEARAYLAHPLLGERLRECTAAVLTHEVRAEEMLGSIDAMKLQSSMTLFECARVEDPLFGKCLDRFFEGRRDTATLRLLESDAHSPL